MLIADGGRLRVVAVAGLPEDDLLGTALEMQGSYLGEVLDRGTSVALVDVAGDQSVPSELVGRAGSMMLVPLRTPVALSGVLALGWTRDAVQSFLDTDVRLVQAYADQAALAMQVAQAREDRSRLAVSRTATGSGATCTTWSSSDCSRSASPWRTPRRLADRPRCPHRISTAVDDIDATIKDIRRTIFELSAPPGSPDLRAQVSEAVAAVVPALGFTPRLSWKAPSTPL